MSEILSNYKNNFKDIFFEDKSEYNVTFRAIEKETNKNVFLKVYDKKLIEKGQKDFLLKQIEREDKITQLCKFENIVELYKKLETDLSIIFVYEYCFKSLSDYFKENGELKKRPKFFKKIVQSIAQALKLLFDKKVIHRDIKPHNIYIQKKDFKSEAPLEENCIIKLGDFGSSILIEDNDSAQIGTLLYICPEIIKNIKYNEKCDIWSLGITLYHLYFGFSPYGLGYDFDKIQDCIFSNNFIYKFSDIPTLDILFRKLLSIEPKYRMNHEEFYEYVFNKEFMEPNVIYKKEIYDTIYNEIQNIKNSEEYKNLNLDTFIKEEKYEGEFNLNQMKQIAKVGKNMDIIYLKSKEIEKTESLKFNNIIYYNDNSKKIYEEKIQKEIESFQNQTKGAFFFCNSIESLNLIMNEISKQFEKEKRYIFNLIVTGKLCENTIIYLKNNNFENIINKICIFCMNRVKYLPLKEKYSKIYDVFITRYNVEQFINKLSDENIKPFSYNKLITYEEYQKNYFDSHQKISSFYGKLDPESYKEKIIKLENLIKKDELNLKKNKDILLPAFQTFNLDKDLDYLNKKIINEYTKNTFYCDLNRWLRNINKYSYEEVAYFTARFMYSLNEYADKNKKYYNINKGKLFRGAKLNYSSLLSYSIAKGKKILLTSFTSMSKDKKEAEKFANVIKVLDKRFSVMYYITNLYEKKNWISNGVDIQDISKFKNEKEVLFQPFSFYYVKDVNIDIPNQKAEIYLETIGKEEILEKSIQEGKHIKYNDKLKIIQSF